MDIQGRTVFITGANRGIGAAITAALKVAGAKKVYAAARDPDTIRIDGVEKVQLDVTNPAQITAAAARATDVDLLINNAGILLPSAALMPEADELFLRQVEVNVLGPLRMTRAFAPRLNVNGGGYVVNVHSVLSWLSFGVVTPYSASKAALWAFTNGLRVELRSQRTRVLGVHFAYVDTDMTAGLSVPKLSAEEVAASILQAVSEGKEELLVDPITDQVKRSLSSEQPAYLNPPST